MGSVVIRKANLIIEDDADKVVCKCIPPVGGDWLFRAGEMTELSEEADGTYTMSGSGAPVVFGDYDVAFNIDDEQTTIAILYWPTTATRTEMLTKPATPTEDLDLATIETDLALATPGQTKKILAKLLHQNKKSIDFDYRDDLL